MRISPRRNFLVAMAIRAIIAGSVLAAAGHALPGIAPGVGAY